LHIRLQDSCINPVKFSEIFVTFSGPPEFPQN
jgi:hypothetical protein